MTLLSLTIYIYIYVYMCVVIVIGTRGFYRSNFFFLTKKGINWSLRKDQPPNALGNFVFLFQIAHTASTTFYREDCRLF